MNPDGDATDGAGRGADDPPVPSGTSDDVASVSDDAREPDAEVSESDGEFTESDGDAHDTDDETGTAGNATASDSVVERLERASVVEDAPAVEGVDVRLPPNAKPPDRIASVLVPIAGGPHSGAAIDFSRALAAGTDAWLELFHVRDVEGDGSEGAVGKRRVANETGSDGSDGDGADGDGANGDGADGERIVAAAERRLGEFERVDRWLVDEESPAAAIIEQSAYYDVVVLGESTSGRVERFVHGSTTGTVAEEAACPVVVVTAEGDGSLLGE